MSNSREWRRSMIAGAASLGLGISCFSGSSAAQVTVTENFSDDPATDADTSTNWINVGGVSYNFQAEGDTTGSAIAPPGGTATGAGEAGGASGAGGYYGDDFGTGTLDLTKPLSIKGVFAIGGNNGGHFFGYVNSAALPLATSPRDFNPAQFFGIRTNSGSGGHSVQVRIG